MRRRARMQDAQRPGICPDDRDYLVGILKTLEEGSPLSAMERARFRQILRDYCSFRSRALVIDHGEHQRRTYED
ncbi:MAG TPA: hypothetical protein VKT32_12375 [Chthonomonadaceae bacterium]|nr:hypothetical protein [Chthonomonadaceae bacterium]